MSVPFEKNEWYETIINDLKEDWDIQYEGKNVEENVEYYKKLFIERLCEDSFENVDRGLFEEEVSREQVLLFMKKEWEEGDYDCFEDDYYLNLEYEDFMKYFARAMVSHFCYNYIDEETGEYIESPFI